MCKSFMDMEDGDFCFSVSDNMAMDSEGHMMMRMGDNMAMDMESGELHMVSSWDDDDEQLLSKAFLLMHTGGAR